MGSLAPAVVVSDPAERRNLAEAYRPTLFQEFGSVFDLISPISLEEVADVIEHFHRITSLPTLNYGVREDKEYWYIYYMVYHPFDVSMSPVALIRKLDSHRHDTEAILLRASKKEVGVIDAITVSHFRFVGKLKSDLRFVIEANTHAIKPLVDVGPKGNFLTYKVYDLIDLNAMTNADWETMRTKLDGASMPDEQYDSGILNSPQGRRKNERGDIWNHPGRLFDTMGKLGRFL